MGCASRFSAPSVEYAAPAELPLVHVPADRRRLYVRVPGLDNSLWFVDTGYSQTTCDTDWIEEQGIASRRSLVFSRSGAFSGWVPLRIARLPAFRLGDHYLDEMACPSRDLQATSSIKDERVAGVLGTNLFRRFTVVLDMESGVLRLHDPDELRVDDGVRMRLSLEGARAELPLEIGDKQRFPLFDTGATGTYVNARPHELPLVVEREVTWSSTGTRPDKKRIVQYYQADTIGLAGAPLDEGLTLLHQPWYKPQIVGMDLIRHFNITLDYVRRRCRVEPVTPARLPVDATR